MKLLRNKFLINLIRSYLSPADTLRLLFGPLQHLFTLQTEALCLRILRSMLLLSEKVLSWSHTQTILLSIQPEHG